MRSTTVGQFLADEYPRLVEPVVAAMLTPAERDVVRIVVADWDGTELDADASLTWSVLLFRDGDVDGAALGVPILEPGIDLTDDEFADRVRSDLQDFIAESTFGWGQLRG